MTILTRKVAGSCVEPLNIPWNILCLMMILTRKVVGSCVEPFNRSNQGGRGKWHSELHTQILIRDFRFRFDSLVCVEWIFIHYLGWIILIKICFLWNCFVLYLSLGFGVIGQVRWAISLIIVTISQMLDHVGNDYNHVITSKFLNDNGKLYSYLSPHNYQVIMGNNNHIHPLTITG